MTAPFRVFSGWDRRQSEAAEVFAASVERRASIPVEMRFVGQDVSRQGVTAFTYARFMVPNLCGYEGVAL